MDTFKLNDKIANDSLLIKKLELSELRMIKDGQNPWFLLIPKIANMIDWSDLSREDQHKLNDEIDYVCKVIKSKSSVDKVNIASLGNIVPQLHIHVIGRFKSDRAWPGPIWGSESPIEFKISQYEQWKQCFIN